MNHSTHYFQSRFEKYFDVPVYLFDCSDKIWSEFSFDMDEFYSYLCNVDGIEYHKPEFMSIIKATRGSEAFMMVVHLLTTNHQQNKTWNTITILPKKPLRL